MTSKIAITGAGPSGIFCALQLLERFKQENYNDFFITIFDFAPVLRTLLPTGNGRCNITNSTDDLKDFCSNYPRGEKFLYSIFSRFSNYDAIDYFNSIGIKTYVQEDKRVFPLSNSAKDVKDKVLNRLNKFKNFKFINQKINSIEELKEFDYKVIATGSKTPDKLLKSTKADIIPFKKALCALKIENNLYPSGVSINSLDGDFIFTPEGISGPLAFRVSSLNALEDFPYEITIRLFDVEKLKEKMRLNPKKAFGNIVSDFVPKSFAHAHIKDFSKNCAEISKKEIENSAILKLKIISTLDYGQIVGAGGVELKCLNKNLRFKKDPSIWFIGEILNIDGFCGGFNLQNCWSDAYIVAQDIIFDIMKK